MVSNGAEIRNDRNGQGMESTLTDHALTSPVSLNTGKIAYLVIGRGGAFGFDEKYVPLPRGTLNMPVGEGL